jgi:hypothetical protein
MNLRYFYYFNLKYLIFIYINYKQELKYKKLIKEKKKERNKIKESSKHYKGI